jgi:hypothetical protein
MNLLLVAARNLGEWRERSRFFWLQILRTEFAWREVGLGYTNPENSFSEATSLAAPTNVAPTSDLANPP